MSRNNQCKHFNINTHCKLYFLVLIVKKLKQKFLILSEIINHQPRQIKNLITAESTLKFQAKLNEFPEQFSIKL